MVKSCKKTLAIFLSMLMLLSVMIAPMTVSAADPEIDISKLVQDGTAEAWIYSGVSDYAKWASFHAVSAWFDGNDGPPAQGTRYGRQNQGVIIDLGATYNVSTIELKNPQYGVDKLVKYALTDQEIAGFKTVGQGNASSLEIHWNGHAMSTNSEAAAKAVSKSAPSFNTTYSFNYDDEVFGTFPGKNSVDVNLSGRYLYLFNTSGNMTTDEINVYGTKAGATMIPLTLDHNYNDSDGNPVTSLTQLPADEETSLASYAPTREGWTFGGWFYDAACQQPVGASITISEATTIYANWLENFNFSLVFNNGQPDQVAALADGTVPTKPEDPRYPLHTFGGWYTDAECTEGNEVNWALPITSDTVYYAKWIEQDLFSVNLYSEGALVETKNYAAGTHAKLAEVPPVPEGMMFAGWYSDEAFSTAFDWYAVHEVGETLNAYAKWEPIPEGIVTGKIDVWDGINNGAMSIWSAHATNNLSYIHSIGLFDNIITAEKYPLHGSEQSKTISTPIGGVFVLDLGAEYYLSEAKLQKYQFKGDASIRLLPLSEDPQIFSSTFADGNSWLDNGGNPRDMVVRVVDKNSETYTVENGAIVSGSDSIYNGLQSETIKKAGTYNVNLSALDPNGYLFDEEPEQEDPVTKNQISTKELGVKARYVVGFATNDMDGTIITIDPQRIRELELYGAKAANTVTYMDGETVIGTETIAFGDTITNTAPQVPGKSFVGWYTDAALQNPFETTTAITTDTVLYGAFTTSQVTVSYYYGQTLIKEEQANTGSAVTYVPTTADVGLDDSYAFRGWYTDAALQIPFSASSIITGELELYAKFSQQFTVNFYNSEDAEAPIATESIYDGEYVTYTGATPTAYFKVFDGWTADGTTHFDLETVAVTENLNLYPLWVLKSKEVGGVTYEILQPNIQSESIVHTGDAGNNIFVDYALDEGRWHSFWTSTGLSTTVITLDKLYNLRVIEMRGGYLPFEGTIRFYFAGVDGVFPETPSLLLDDITLVRNGYTTETLDTEIAVKNIKIEYLPEGEGTEQAPGRNDIKTLSFYVSENETPSYNISYVNTFEAGLAEDDVLPSDNTHYYNGMQAALLPFENKSADYVFVGWSTTQPGDDGTLAEGATLYTLEPGLDTVAITDADITLYAVWSSKVDMKMPGASIRTAAPQGLRFLTVDNVHTYARGYQNIERSTLIIPKDLLEEGTHLTIDTPNLLKIEAQNYRFIADLFDITQQEEYRGVSGFAFAGTLTEIPELSYDRKISAISYIHLMDESRELNCYANGGYALERSVYDVAGAIIQANYADAYNELLAQVETTGKSIGQLCFERYFNF